jgi:pSer/pThr/pTyr-binding forkhead associated (FHA) protein
MEKQPKFFKIGRADDNQIVIDHITVSRNHAEIFVDPYENVFLTDRNSKYGTIVNGSKIYEPVILKSGDTVQVGDDQYIDWENIIFGKPKRKFITDKKVENIPVQSKKDLRYYLDVIIIYFAVLLMILVLYLQNS